MCSTKNTGSELVDGIFLSAEAAGLPKIFLINNFIHQNWTGCMSQPLIFVKYYHQQKMLAFPLASEY